MKPRVGLPTLVAHRGNALEFPENTLPAFESAVALGVRHVECDVQLTADAVPVVVHDADLRRVGANAASVHDRTWPELAAIPVGEPGRLGMRHEDVRLASLADLAAAITRWDDVTVFVEIKRASLRRFGHDLVLRRVAEVLRPVLAHCVWISFDRECVERLRRDTGARIGWVLEHYDDATQAAARSLAPEFLFGDVDELPPGRPLWPGPWDWAIYEVRDVATARRYGELGAAYVETMAVREMVEAYQSANERS
jgi:glycerophosphoryl diester phosphodiesterase